VTRPGIVAQVGIVLALVACSGPPTPTADGTPGPSEPAGTSTASGIIGDPGNPLSLRPPARPYDAADILLAMRDSRRPGGVAADLQTDAIAAAVARTVWTLQGDRWETASIGGSCGVDACILELAGSAAGDAGEDLWVLSVSPTSGAVDVVTADLHAIPSATVEAIDRMARGAEGGAGLADLLLTSVRWQPPPDDGTFVLAYRSGDEEESCTVDIELDVDSGELTEVDSTGC
jgi:hypothetical protein